MSGPGARTLKTHWMLVITGLSVALTACASSNPETEGSLVWASENDYVRIEPHEQGRDVVPNQHPVSFSDEQIQQLLTTVEVARPRGRLETLVGRGDDAASLPVFTDRELRKLAAPLAEALAAAEPENDVLFSVSSFRKGELLGALGSTRSTTGRIFYQDDQLNLILGAVLVDPRQALEPRGHPYSCYVSKIDRAQQPLSTGSRIGSHEHTGDIVPTSGLTLASVDGEQRGDWALISPETLSAHAQEAPDVIDKDEPATAAPVTEPETEVTEEERPDQDDLEARLAKLKRLLDRDLISEDLYNKKSAEILADL